MEVCGHGADALMNPSTEQARALVEGLLRTGIDTVVVAPGSRNGPLSIALAQAAHAGKVHLHVRVDERSASFLALGMAKRLGQPTAVVCTSGTATAHFHAAAYEATEMGVPLLLLTADRPPLVRHRGANQSIDQREMFGPAVVKSIDCALAEQQPATHWRAVISDAVAAARGNASTAPGAVHINLPFAEPLVPGDGDTSWVQQLPDVVPPRASTDVARATWSKVWPQGGETPRGVVITSDPSHAADVVALAEALQWPVLAEPGSGARCGNTAILRYLDLLERPELAPDVVLTVGRFGLSRSVASFVRNAPRHISVGRRTLDPLLTIDEQIARLPDVGKLKPTSPAWLSAWKSADVQAQRHALTRQQLLVATVLEAAAPGDLVWYGPSSVIRDAERAAPAFDDIVTSYMNRGANGIDGVVSSAIGAALAHQRLKHDAHALVLLGDLTLLHDINGFLLPQGPAAPNITFVVIDSNGGRIFKRLEQGAAEYAPVFDTVYGTPHDRDLVAILSAYGVNASRLKTAVELRATLDAVREQSGIKAIVVDDQE